MIIKTKKDIPSSEITSESSYKNRRQFLKQGANVAMGVGVTASGLLSPTASAQIMAPRSAAQLNLASKPEWLAQKMANTTPVPNSGPYTTNEMLTPYQDVTNYNNFYEYGTGKQDPSNNARNFQMEPWSVEITGEVNKPGIYYT